MKTVEKTVVDIKKLTDEEIGKLFKKANEIIRRSNEGTIFFEDSLEVMQKIIIEGKSAQHLDVIKGLARITYPEHLIDCDALPFIPNGWSIEKHKRDGLFEFDPKKISLYFSKKQGKGNISGYDLRKELANQSILNANVLDYLLVHPELIPEEWKDRTVFFWGTIYRDYEGNFRVRCLHRGGSSSNRLDDDFYPGNPAAIANFGL